MPADLASIFENATVTDLSALVQYAQQKSCEGSEAPVIIASAENRSDQDGYPSQNLADLTAILTALDPEELKQLLNQLQQE